VTIYGLNPNTTYEWRVRANCGPYDHSNWSAPSAFTTEGSSQCYAPSSLSTFNITQTTATWDWNSVGGAYSYSVQWRIQGNVNWNDLQGGPWQQSYLNVGNLQPGTTYEWRVRSNCSNGSYSEWSEPDVFTTDGSGCSMPQGLTTTGITQTSATYNWEDVSGAVSYSVQRRLPNGLWYYINGSPFYTTNVTEIGLNPGTTYEWRVRANCGGNSHSYWTNGVSFTTLMGLQGVVDTPINMDAENLVPDEGTAIELIETENVISKTAPSIDVTVTPNPSTDYFTITCQPTDGCGVAGIALHDFSGKTIMLRQFTDAIKEEVNERIDVTALAPGTYVLQVITTCGMVTEQVVVTR
jgi:hypothetical protein